MKLQTLRSGVSLVVSLLLMTGVAEARTDITVGFSSGHDRHSHYRHHRPQRYAPVYYAPYRYHHPHNYRPYGYRHVNVTPIVVPQPIYVPSPESYPALSGNYGQDLGTFREKLNRLRLVVEKQKDKGGIPQPSYDRFMSTLDGIERDLQARLYERGGTLKSEDFSDFFRRLDQANEEVQMALAE